MLPYNPCEGFVLPRVQKYNATIYNDREIIKALDVAQGIAYGEMMSIAKAINDVIRFAHNDAMFALMCPQAYIISEAASLAKPTSFARKGKHH